MAGAPVGKIIAAFAAVFAVSLGAGYGVSAQVRGPVPDDGATAGPATAPTNSPATTSASSTTETPSAPSTTTAETVPPKPARRGPLRVVLAGDSVMAGLSPAMKAALGSKADVRFILTPSILRDPAVRFTWEQQLEEFNPELVVMFVGTWESGVVRTSGGLAVNDPRWRPQYEQEILNPWIDLVTGRGAKVLWIGNPIVRNDDANQLFAALNAAFRDLPGRREDVRFVDSNPPLNGPLPGYHDVVDGIGGRRFRTRQTDGLHLCADGSALLTSVVARQLNEWFALPPANGWEQGSWRDDVVFPAASCPAP